MNNRRRLHPLESPPPTVVLSSDRNFHSLAHTQELIELQRQPASGTPPILATRTTIKQTNPIAERTAISRGQKTRCELVVFFGRSKRRAQLTVKSLCVQCPRRRMCNQSLEDTRARRSIGRLIDWLADRFILSGRFEAREKSRDYFQRQLAMSSNRTVARSVLSAKD